MRRSGRITDAARARSRRRALFATALLAASIGSTVSVAAKDEFSLYKLSVPGELLHVAHTDLNGDGLDDLLALHKKGLPPAETRWISVFRQDALLGFGGAADQSWVLDSAAAVVDVGNIDGMPGDEICFFTGDAVRYYARVNGRFGTGSLHLIDVASLTVFPSVNQAPLIDFVRDWDGRPGDEIAVPGFDGLTIHFPDTAGGYSGMRSVQIDLKTRVVRRSHESVQGQIAGLRASFSFPDLTVEDFNGDGFADLFATDDDNLRVFRQSQNGGFDTTASAAFDFDVRTTKEKLEQEAELQSVISDLNCDGFADAVVTKMTAKGLSSFRSVLHIFWGRAGGYANVADQVIISEGSASALALVRDVNGDGKFDLIMPSVRISIMAIIRVLITRNIPVTFNVFLLHDDPDGEGPRYSERPDFEKEVKFKIDFSGESDTQAMDIDGDYDGDGRTDFVFATDDDELSVYLAEGNPSKSLYTKKAVTKVEADAYGDLQTVDLNRDGFSDMVITYPQTKDRKGDVQVLINRGRW